MTRQTIDLTRGAAEYVTVVVAERTGADITGITVEFGFVGAVRGGPVSTWHPATVTAGDDPGKVHARLLVTSATCPELAIGRYDLVVRIHDVPELPVRTLADAVAIR